MRTASSLNSRGCFFCFLTLLGVRQTRVSSVHFGASLADIEAKLGAPLLDSGRTDECVRSFPAIETADEQVERTLYYADPDTRQTLELAFLRERLDRIRWSSHIE